MKNLGRPDKTKENIEKLLALSENSGAKMSSSSAQAIIEHSVKSKRHYEPKSRKFLNSLKPEKKAEQTSIFSEEDFETLSKQYFCNSDPLNQMTLERKREREQKLE